MRAGFGARQGGRRRRRQRPPDEERQSERAQQAHADIGIAPCLVGTQMGAAMLQARVLAHCCEARRRQSRVSIDSLA
jgi:hypothetical protein